MKHATAVERRGERDRETTRATPARPREPPDRTLQRRVGNRAIQRAVRRERTEGSLAIGAPDDRYEREADRIAASVMRRPTQEAGPVSTRSAPLDRLQRLCPRCRRRLAVGAPLNCPECEGELRRMPSSSGMPVVDRHTERRIRSARGGGRPLAQSARAFFERRFGTDFGDVRVHTGARAAEASRSVNADAFTLGRDVFFGRGEYRPDARAGRRLLAHELAHVVQQRSDARGSGGSSHRIQRRVEAGRVSCERYPKDPSQYPIFRAINTTDPVGVLRSADARAIEMLTTTIDELSYVRTRVRAGEDPSWPLISDAVARAMHRRLRLDPSDPDVWTGTGPGTVELVIRWYSNVRTLLRSGGIRYTCLDPGCSPGDWAFVFVPSRRIRLCRRFWRDTRDNRALTLVHEAAHLYYGLADTGGGPGSAHCLEQFLADANGVPITPGLVGSCSPP